MSHVLQQEQLLKALNWRYATKKFDETKKIPADEFHTLEESLRLAPSSFGLQPWKFIVVTDPAKRAMIRTHAWNQSQVTDASHLIVLTHQKDVGEKEIDTYLQHIAQVRKAPVEVLKGYREMMVGLLVKGPNHAVINPWAAKQVYIALGVLLTSAAMLGIDTCPLEGFSKEDVDKVLDLERQGLASVVLCALGYRAVDDKYAHLPKVRYEKNLVIEKV